MSSVFGILIAPLCGWILDYKVNRGLYKVYFLCNFILLFFFLSRLFAKNVESFYYTNNYLVNDINTLYCLYVSINRCCYSGDSNFHLFTYNARNWMSSSYRYNVNIDRNFTLILDFFFLKISTSVYRYSSWSNVDNSGYY
jgi:hypothetical protein